MAGRSVVALVGISGEAGISLCDYLERRGYDVRVAEEHWAADSVLSNSGVDVAVIDMSTDDSSALGLLKSYGGEAGPFFILIAKNSDLVERVLGLELGAADVVERPVNVRELAARIGGLVARRGKGLPDLMRFERSTVDLKAALVMHKSGSTEALSAGQIALLRLFIGSPHKVLTRDDIMSAAPAENADAFDRSIDSRIVRLRRKLDTEAIATVRGAGYRYDPPAG